MPTDAEKRLTMIVTAMKEVSNGSHYMKGGDGAIPGHDGTGLQRNVELLDDLTIENLGVHAAKNGFGVCRGRWEKMTGGMQFVKGMTERDTLLPAYLEELKSSWLPSFFWKDFNNTGLFPRRSSGYIYLGEDCRGKKHFDCEGFVAWVLVKALGKDNGTWRKGVSWYQEGGGGRLDVYQASGSDYVSDDLGTISQSEIRDGDILIRKPNSQGGEHIGIARVNGNGVLEASGKNSGVIASVYQPNWTQLARLKTL
jgi:hypothetical protein